MPLNTKTAATSAVTREIIMDSLRILMLVLQMNIFEMHVRLKRLQIDPEKLVAGTNRSQGVLRARAFYPGSEYREPF